MTDVAAQASAEIAGEENLCPHCRGQTRLEPHPELRWACAACGGPRIRVKDARARTKKSVALLVKADGERKAAAVRRFASIGFGLTGALMAGLGAALGAAVVAIGVVLTLVALPMLVTAFMMVLAAKKRRTEARRLAFEAWEDVAEALLKLHGKDATIDEMAELLGVDVAEAERVMTVLAAEDRARVDIGTSAELRYRVADGATASDAAATAEALQIEAEQDAAAGARADRGGA